MVNNQRGFIQNIAIIAVILAVVFLSQQYSADNKENGAYSQIMAQTQQYISKAEDVVKTDIGGKVSGEVAKQKEHISQEVTTQKNNLVQNIWENIKHYFAEKFSKTFGTEVK